MKQIVNNILKQQGFEHIGLLDKENNIWVYAKDGVLHFCKDDLTPLDRNHIGSTLNLIVLTESEEGFRIVKEGDLFRNFIVVDKNNRIIIHAHSNEKIYEKVYFTLKKIKDNSFVIVEEECWREGFPDYKPIRPYFTFTWRCDTQKYSYLFIDDEYWESYNLYRIHHDFYFFKECKHDRAIIFKKDIGIIYKGKVPYLWIHKNETTHLVLWENDYCDEEDNNEQHSIIKIQELGSCLQTFNVNRHFYLGEEDILFSDDYLVFPFNEYNRYSGAFVIDNTDCFLSANTIWFDDAYCPVSISLHNKLIRIEREDQYCLLYSIYGNLHTEFYLEQGRSYIVFDVQNNGFFPYELDKTKGVVNLPDNIIIPPIYKEINILDDDIGLFELNLLNYANGKSLETKGIYSIKKGFIIPLGGEFSFPFYNEMFSLQVNNVKDFIIFKQGGKKGLMFRGEKVLDAEYDDIVGFSFNEDFEKTPDWCIAETRTKEYTPLCVLLYKKGKWGLFANISNYQEKKYDTIEPIFDNIHKCVKVFKGHAYFAVEKDGKKGIVSDNLIFNQKNEIKYDTADYETVVAIHGSWGEECYFTVTEKGRVGAICTNEKYDIPVIFERIDKIIISGVLIGKTIFTRNGEELCSLEDGYKYIPTRYFDVFIRANTDDDYVFIDSRGNRVKYSKESRHILHLDGGYRFDTETKEFIEEEEYDNPPIYDYDEIDWEEETYYALGGSDYNEWRENGGNLDDMMDGMGL